ncbi:hypothetical protein PN462_17305 [Spirulina sp. CS-785/01]|uniref:acyltransferase n=1 Tax=Spirulina sp. CS-785/01 TaxID=3021716 RepID=UPI00232B612F|nr:hypothetical protein [Spirulina sp. CS-785/01]MDB9314875.1 hypothetical protein [Spirulina sp. CS-785/01]
MTLLSLLLAWFPTLILLLTGLSLFWTVYSPSLYGVAAILFCLYGFPLLCHRIHNYFYPLESGISYLVGDTYSPWWGSHQFQRIYIALPVLESLLRLIPGLFSLWLRGWGAKVGKNVYWTPHIEISDRAFLDIGNNVIMGYNVQLYSHIIKPRKDNLMLYLKPIKIGNNVFVGAGSIFAPGSVVEDNTKLNIETRIYPNKNACEVS